MSYPGYPYGYPYGYLYGGGAPYQGTGGRASDGSSAYGSQNPAGGSQGDSAFARSMAGFGAQNTGQIPQYRTSQHYSSSSFDDGAYSGYGNTQSTTRTESTSYYDLGTFSGNFGCSTGSSSTPSANSSFADSFSGFGRASSGGNTGTSSGFTGESAARGNAGSYSGFSGGSTASSGSRSLVKLSGLRFENRGSSGSSEIRPGYTVEEPDGTEEYFPPRRY